MDNIELILKITWRGRRPRVIDIILKENKVGYTHTGTQWFPGVREEGWMTRGTIEDFRAV